MGGKIKFKLNRTVPLKVSLGAVERIGRAVWNKYIFPVIHKSPRGKGLRASQLWRDEYIDSLLDQLERRIRENPIMPGKRCYICGSPVAMPLVPGGRLFHGKK